MVAWWRSQPSPSRCWWRLSQRATLVNVKLKWVKDRTLDSVVAREKRLRPTHHLIEEISARPSAAARAQDLSTRLRVPIATFVRRFPSLFSYTPSSDRIGLTDDASRLRREELGVVHETEAADLVDRLRKLLMMTKDRRLPIHTIQQLRWDMGLPHDFHCTLVPRFPHFFRTFQPPDDERVWIELLHWDESLATSHLQEDSGGGGCLAFPVSFTRGFGLKRKCAAWLKEWQTLPYTSPYEDASGLDPRTDVSEKRIVGVFHELLHLTLAKKTERKNVSNMRKPLGLPYKFTKVFERHPGIFYLSQKLATQTVVLREAYNKRQLLTKHPLIGIRERYAAMIRDDMNEIEEELEEEEDGSSCDTFFEYNNSDQDQRI
ncbi:uncharacterized protein M6B38_208730 [Iris pallida]|uniref:PORR domain-containing protein n=1 Tax=Iris pallida TaxID=29817 RepID=A0AAX6E574_IRIPA|nr:uncharacterized protein M6B38_208730 [Iris pallida]